jgi:competence protein ComEC
VNEDGTAAAVRGPDGHLALLGGRTANFEKQLWLRADADGRDLADQSLAAGVACDALGCTAPLATGKGVVALATRPDAVEEDCRAAAIVIAPFDVPTDCAAGVVIGRRALALHGAHAVYVDDDAGYTVATAYPAVRRPFMPPLRGVAAAAEASDP